MESEDDENYCELLTAANRKGKRSGGFQAMGLDHAVFKGVMKKGYRIPTPIQRKAIPLILSGKDVVAMSRTGSGKTAAFLVPMFQALKARNPSVCVRALVVTPTRELALQTFKFVKELGKFLNLKAVAVVGGESIENHFAAIHENPDILIATPGRLLHIVVEMNLSLKNVNYIVFDEADRLFELGFDEQLREILNRLPDDRQTLLFSATLPKSLVDFAQAGLRQPTLVRLDVDSKLSDKLTLVHLLCRDEEKMAVLLSLLEKCLVVDGCRLTVIFCATKLFVEYVHEVLERLGFRSTFLYSSMDPEARRINVDKFRRGQANILVVTDLAARGVDIPLLHTAINFHFPAKPKLFVHRVGRVARAGQAGQAVSIISSEEVPYLLDLYLFLGRSLRYANGTDEQQGDSDIIGSFPESVTSAEDRVKTLLENDTELLSMQRTAYRSMKQYGSSKPLCSAESARRAKASVQLQNLTVHPITVSIAAAAADLDSKRVNMLKGIRDYRPGSTVVRYGLEKKLKRRRNVQENKSSDDIVERDTDAAADVAQIENVFTEMVRSKFFDSSKQTTDKRRKQNMRSEEDQEYFVPFAPTDFHSELGLMVNRDAFVSSAESAVVDFLHDDENMAQRRKDKKLKWDRKRNRFVNTDEVAAKKKKIRTESGAWISASYKSDAYDSWKRKLRLGALENEADDVDKAKRLKFLRTSQRRRIKGKLPVRSELKKTGQIYKSFIRKERMKNQSKSSRRKTKRV